jgi:hypothetical protein
MRGVVFSLVALGIMTLGSGCKKGPGPAGGQIDHVICVCDDEEWERSGDLIRRALEVPESYTVMRLPIFSVRHVSPSEFDLYSRRRTLLMVAALEPKGTTAQLLLDILDEPSLGAIRADRTYLFGFEDVYARDQTVLVVCAPDTSTLQGIVRMEGETIFRFFDANATKRIWTIIYGDGYQKELARRLASDYGWSIKLPLGYTVTEEDPEAHYFEAIRHTPDRVILVHWEDDARSEITPEWCMDLRDHLAAEHLEGDRVGREFVDTERFPFKGNAGIRLQGLWQNDARVMGGPMVTYCFYDSTHSRRYLFDTHLFEPGGKQYFLMRQLELIAATFAIGDTVPPWPEDPVGEQ